MSAIDGQGNTRDIPVLHKKQHCVGDVFGGAYTLTGKRAAAAARISPFFAPNNESSNGVSTSRLDSVDADRSEVQCECTGKRF
jgi:hypothetical protein